MQYTNKILLCCFLLLALGLVMVFSASGVYGINLTGNSEIFVTRQFLYVLGFIIISFIISKIPLAVFYKMSKPIMAIVLVLLGALLIPGVGSCYNRACRWYILPGGIHFQPAEYAKVFWTVYLANALFKRKEKLANFREGILFYTILMGILAALVLMEPDFGNAVLIMFVTIVMLAAAGVPWRHFLVYLLIGVAGFYFFVYRVEYRWERILSTYNPWVNPQKEGYQIIQSWIAIGSGGLLGQGLGNGLQKLRFLPEPFTDFILSIGAQELGFLGFLFILAIYALLFFCFFKVTSRIRDERNGLLATGLFSLLAVQVLSNCAVVVGILPTKGLPLPFISYGGSHLIASGIMIGLWLRMIREELEIQKTGGT